MSGKKNFFYFRDPAAMKRITTNFGEPLSVQSKKLVSEVRLKITQPIHPNVSTKFFYFPLLKKNQTKTF